MYKRITRIKRVFAPVALNFPKLVVHQWFSFPARNSPFSSTSIPPRGHKIPIKCPYAARPSRFLCLCFFIYLFFFFLLHCFLLVLSKPSFTAHIRYVIWCSFFKKYYYRLLTIIVFPSSRAYSLQVCCLRSGRCLMCTRLFYNVPSSRCLLSGIWLIQL